MFHLSDVEFPLSPRFCLTSDFWFTSLAALMLAATGSSLRMEARCGMHPVSPMPCRTSIMHECPRNTFTPNKRVLLPHTTLKDAGRRPDQPRAQRRDTPSGQAAHPTLGLLGCNPMFWGSLGQILQPAVGSRPAHEDDDANRRFDSTCTSEMSQRGSRNTTPEKSEAGVLAVSRLAV